MSQCDAIVVLENVRSAHNVGAIFRTAEAIGVRKIILVGYTPTPIDRYGRVQPDIKKTALGADGMIPWEHKETIDEVIENCRKEGVRVIAVERTDGAIDYKAATLGERAAFIFGNEVDGVSRTAIDCADQVVSLPMRGKKESLNVSTTVGIVLYRLLDQ